MKIAILADTHFGCRLNSKIFVEAQKKFYENVFFPSVSENRPDLIIHLGDLYDDPKELDINIMRESKKMFIDPVNELGVPVYILVGNHDIYHKNTNEISSVREIIGDFYKNITVVDVPQKLIHGGIQIDMIPWMNQSNEERCLDFLAKPKDENKVVCLGHFDIIGANFNKHVINKDKGLDQTVFRRYNLTLSGHYHLRHKLGNIHYVGNTNEIDKSDYNTSKGFCYLNSDLSIEYVDNPYNVFERITYDDSGKKVENLIAEIIDRDFSGKCIEVVVEKKNKHKLYAQYVAELEKLGASKIEYIDKDSLDTLEKTSDKSVFWADKDFSLLIEKNIEQSDYSHKNVLKKLMLELYTQALNVTV